LLRFEGRRAPPLSLGTPAAASGEAAAAGLISWDLAHLSAANLATYSIAQPVPTLTAALASRGTPKGGGQRIGERPR